MGLPLIDFRARFLWSLTDFPLKFYNFLIFISRALKNIRSTGQPIRKNKANLIHPFSRGVDWDRRRT
jgi:hypothetical protein